jgi:hypothetical protein
MPMLAMDATIGLYQYVCFPIYGIPKVARRDYIIFDRKYLNYLNVIEKFNYAYCSYANGLLAYMGEMAARTEQFWCPIKHEVRIKNLHGHYQKFINYGGVETYRDPIQTVRCDFKDVQQALAPWPYYLNLKAGITLCQYMILNLGCGRKPAQ